MSSESSKVISKDSLFRAVRTDVVEIPALGGHVVVRELSHAASTRLTKVCTIVGRDGTRTLDDSRFHKLVIQECLVQPEVSEADMAAFDDMPVSVVMELFNAVMSVNGQNMPESGEGSPKDSSSKTDSSDSSSDSPSSSTEPSES